MNKLDNFLFSEQCFNNYSLYGDEMKGYFTLNLPKEYLPESQCFFRLPYFIVPIDVGKNTFKIRETDFFERNLFLNHNGKKCYSFFVHPCTQSLFKEWIDGGYDFVDCGDSEFEATPLSSFRSLFVKHIKTDDSFIVKLSVFDNVANGARHIDWNSASGQYEASQIVKKVSSKIENIEFFEDIGAFGIDSDRAIFLSDRFDVRIGSRRIYAFGNVIRKIPVSMYNDDENIVCSVAAFTSLMRKEGSYISCALKNSGLIVKDFLDIKVFSPLFRLFLNLFEEYGIVLEPHCQNVILELDKKNIPTGKIYYRDFDLTTFDRARFPFLYKDIFLEYIRNRPDRTILCSNLGMRENIGIGFFVHFLGNLIKPCLVSLEKQRLISEEDKTSYLKEKFNEIRIELKKRMPFADSEFCVNSTEWIFNSNIFGKIHKSEIPDELKELHADFNFENYEKFLLYNGVGKELEYFISKNNIVLGFYKDILCEMWMEKCVKN